MLGATHQHAINNSYHDAGDFSKYELQFLSVAIRDAVAARLLEKVGGGLAQLMVLVDKSAKGVRCRAFFVS